jgi:iron complex transport system substrate-binding protein
MNIVSLLPSATELLCELGLLPHLVAVSHECDTPAAVASLPRITSSILPHGLDQAEIDAQVSAAYRAGEPLYRIDPALLAELKPRLIVTQGLCDVCAVGEETVRHALHLLPAELLAEVQILSLDGRSVAGVWEDLRRLARAVQPQLPGALAAAEARIATVQAEWEALPGPQPAGPRLLMLEWSDPPFSGGHWVPEQVLQAGGIDVIGAPAQDSRRLHWEEIEAADPDVIALVACGFGLDENIGFARALYSDPRVPPLRALRGRQVLAFDANSDFSRPSLRLVRGAQRLARALAGGPEEAGGWAWVASA